MDGWLEDGGRFELYWPHQWCQEAWGIYQVQCQCSCYEIPSSQKVSDARLMNMGLHAMLWQTISINFCSKQFFINFQQYIFLKNNVLSTCDLFLFQRSSLVWGAASWHHIQGCEKVQPSISLSIEWCQSVLPWCNALASEAVGVQGPHGCF